MLKIFNTLTGKKDAFGPRSGKKVNLFVCGPTVYDYPHIGHAKLAITFDIFVKYLRSRGYNVFYLQNITNIDDKIIARAREKGVLPLDLASAFENEWYKGMKALGVNSVTKYARATDFIKQIISQVQRLLDKGYAYKIEGDGIYYNIARFKNYGKLAGRNVLDAEDSVSRIDYSKDKKNRGDFCLWKFKQEELEPSWPSPFGEGRPGWHIEDTAITEKFFGVQYDIHGGARDLIFPHHEAEIAQMEAISGKRPLAKYWMHIGFLTVNNQKMSKSLGNFITLADLLQRCPAKYLRFLVVKSLWRNPMDYSESAMIEAKAAINKIEEFFRRLPSVKSKTKNVKAGTLIKSAVAAFYEELDNDFNTPRAFAVLFDLIKQANQLLDKRMVSKNQAGAIVKFLKEINAIFGIIDIKKPTEKIPAEIKKLVLQREKNRIGKNWQKSDELRKEIESKGYRVEDTNEGPEIKKT